MSKIKVLHTADIHIGIENYGYINPNTGLNTRMEDFLRSFDIIIDHAINNNFDLVIFAGDAFKVQSPNSTQQREFAKRVYRLALAKIPTILLAGNHDLSNRYGEATSMDIYSALKIDYVYVVEKPQFLNIETKNGIVQIIAIPYVSKSALLTNEDYRSKTVEEVEKILTGRIDELITSQILKADQALPIILTFHVGIDQATIGAEKDLMVGKSFSIPLSVVSRKELDYVALGHIHKFQVLCPKPPVIYSGSIERVDFGEEKEDKGFMVIDLERRNTTFEFIKLPARTFITINVDVTESEDPNHDIVEAIKKKNLKEAIVRLRYTATTNNSHLINDNLIRKYFTDTFFYMIQPNIQDNSPRTRQPELNETVSVDPIQALEKYLVLFPHLEDFKDDLLERAKQLLEVSGG